MKRATGHAFQPYAVVSRTGPHVTMQAGIEQAGRYWTTTAATSLKARSVRAHGHASAALVDGDRTRIVAGRTMALEPFRPWRGLEDPVAALTWGLAVARLGRAHLDQLLGYLEAPGAVPADWLPTRRVLLATRIDRSLTLVDDVVVDRHGDWGDESMLMSQSDALVGALPLALLPATHRSVVAGGSRAHLGVSTPAGPVVLPVRWLGDDRFSVSAAGFAAVNADPVGPASVVFDRSDSRRPDEKQGVMFRGRLRVDDVVDGKAVVGLTTARVTTWDGFAADTVDVGATTVR
mgnify:CR=1 FL=1